MKTKIKLQSALVIIAVLLSATAFSQGIYVNAGAGYGFPAAPYIMGSDRNSYSGQNGFTYKNEIVKGSGSFGKGVQPGAIIGYMFNENIGAELGIGYLFGGKITSKYEYHSDNSSSTSEETMSAKMLRFTPALKMTVGNGNVKPYLRGGLAIGVAGKIKDVFKDTYASEFENSTTEGERELTGGISLGFAGALGADFMLSDNIEIFAEIGIITQSWAPKKGQYTKYVVDGEDQLNDLETSFKEVEFVDSYSYDSENTDYDSPGQALKTYYPFSSVGINVGIRFTFGGKSEIKE